MKAGGDFNVPSSATVHTIQHVILSLDVLSVYQDGLETPVRKMLMNVPRTKTYVANMPLVTTLWALMHVCVMRDIIPRQHFIPALVSSDY